MEKIKEILEDAIKSAPVVENEGFLDIYPNFGSLIIEPQLVTAIVEKLVEIGDFNCDKIALVESMAIPVGTALSLNRKIPYTVIRKRRYNLPDEVSVKEQTGYSRADFYINGITKGQRVVIFDDLINTGETLQAIVTTLRKIGAEVVDILTIMDKGTKRSELERELGIKIKSLVNIKINPEGIELTFEVD
jgi:adenine phosphoribosyltransferase